MGKHIFVNGDLFASTGNLYTRDIAAGRSWYPSDAEIITPEGGVWEIKENTGSIFDSYYVGGFVSAGGTEVGGIKAYADFLQPECPLFGLYDGGSAV